MRVLLLFMSMEGDMRERHGRVLAELAEAGMGLVRRLGEAMARTEDVQTQVQIGLAFHRVSRAVRQTIALEFKLAQEALREPGPARAPEPRASEQRPLETGPTQTAAPPREPVERTSWNEYERDDSDEALDSLDALLGAEHVDRDAVHEAVAASIARIRRDIATDPVLVRAGVLGPPGAAPPPALAGRPAADPGTRRSALMGAAALPGPRVAPPVARPRHAAWRSSA